MRRAIFYVSNCWSEVKFESTVRNLTELGFLSVDAEHIILRDDLKRSDKEPRFDAIAEDYDVVAYMCDNMGDLPLYTSGKTRDERNAIIDDEQEAFGV